MNLLCISDGETCNCGCGIQDSDCIDSSVESCHRCDSTGGCNEGNYTCPGSFDPTNNALCVDLSNWTYDKNNYGDCDCDCDCGIPDIDCTDSESCLALDCPI